MGAGQSHMNSRWCGGQLTLLFVLIAPGLAACGQAATPSTFYTTSHALLIGINRYGKMRAELQLKYAVDDVAALKSMLIKRYGFKRENIRTLTDEEATRANIERELAGLADNKRV